MPSTTRQPDQRQSFSLHRGLKVKGALVAMHAHEEAQLTFVVSGVVQVLTDAGRWLVPSQLAVWAPAWIPHQLDVLADAELLMIYWRHSVIRAWAPSASLDRAVALRVTPLLRVLISAAFTADQTRDKTELIFKLILHEVAESPEAPTFLPLPTSVIGRRLAEFAFADQRNQLDIGALASRAATSVRTVSRLFPVETGLTFKAWRQRARIVRAIDRLSAGGTISQVSADVGFASTAAFSFAFRQVTMMTPTAFLNQQGAARRAML